MVRILLKVKLLYIFWTMLLYRYTSGFRHRIGVFGSRNGFRTTQSYVRALIEHQNEIDLNHLTRSDSKISSYWIDQLKQIEKPAKINQLRSLIPQLVADNELGFDSGNPIRSGTFIDFALQQKKKHPNKVILARNGEFYETFGIDSLMLIAYAGLNPMGNKCKAGCPVKNIQQTLDGLTNMGLSAAVYEEVTELDSNKPQNGGGKVKLKNRVLTQIVSPASSTYIYDLNLRSDDIEFRENRPAVGIMKSVHGYLLCQVFLDEQCVKVYERLTEEGLIMLLSTTGNIDSMIIQGDVPLTNHFFAQHAYQITRLTGYADNEFPTMVLKKFQELLEIPQLTHFRVVNPSQTLQDHTTRPRCLYTSTALQIGLIPNENVPNLLPYLLPKVVTSHAQIMHKFFRKWLTHPPPYEIMLSMQELCRTLSAYPYALPAFQPISIGKVISLLTATQGNVILFRDILTNMRSLRDMLAQAYPTLTTAGMDTCTAQTATSAASTATSTARTVTSTAPTTTKTAPLSTSTPSTATSATSTATRTAFSGTSTSSSTTYTGSMTTSTAATATHTPPTTTSTPSPTPPSPPPTVHTQLLTLLHSLLTLTTYESGIKANPESMYSSSTRIISLIEHIIPGEYTPDEPYQDPRKRIPDEFFKRNEEMFRGKISRAHPVMQKMYVKIQQASVRLSEVIVREIPEGMEICWDVMENVLTIKEKPLPPETPATTIAEGMSEMEKNLSQHLSKTLSETENNLSQNLSKTLSNNLSDDVLRHAEDWTNMTTPQTSSQTLPKPRSKPPKVYVGYPDIDYFPYKDRRGMTGTGSKKRYITKHLLTALHAYTDLVVLAEETVKNTLQCLSRDLSGELVVITQASHFAVILQSVLAHTISALQKGWTLPTMIPFPPVTVPVTPIPVTEVPPIPVSVPSDTISPIPVTVPVTPLPSIPVSLPSDTTPPIPPKPVMRLHHLTPYWLSRDTTTTTTTGGAAVGNTLELQGIFLLTAPNMSGKSTLMRSILTIALLGNCGLFVPCDTGTTSNTITGNTNTGTNTGTTIPVYDGFFLRTSSVDMPVVGKSCFGVEMDDLRVLLREATSRSLVMVDELGRGTSSREGAALCGAVVEELDVRKMSGIFATHLHEMLWLPLKVSTVRRKKMGYRVVEVDEEEHEHGYGNTDNEKRKNMEEVRRNTEEVTRNTQEVTKNTQEVNRNTQEVTRNTQEVTNNIAGNIAGKVSKKCPKIVWTYQLEDGYCTDSMALVTARQYGISPDILSRAETLMSDFDRYCRPSPDNNRTLFGHTRTSPDITTTTTTHAVEEEKEGNYEGNQEGNMEEKEGNYEGNLRFFQERNAKLSTRILPHLQRLLATSYDDTGSNTSADTSSTSSSSSSLSPPPQIVHVPINHHAPAHLEGRSCVYLLHIFHKHKRLPGVLYIGETESLSQRLKQHRVFYARKNADLTCLAFNVDNKSLARQWETRLIHFFKKELGEVFARDTDATHLLFSRGINRA